MRKPMPLIDAIGRVEQAKTTLSVWLEVTKVAESDRHMIGAVMSLLEGVTEAMDEAENSLGDCVMRDHSGGKS
jgi:hypothetical protein